MADFDDNRFQSKSVEWATPDNVYGPLNEEFRFTLDVAASQDNAKCERFFTKDIDALRQDWDGVCWMNPPYGRDVPKWLQKAIDESRRGVTTGMIGAIIAKKNASQVYEVMWWLDSGGVDFSDIHRREFDLESEKSLRRLSE